MKMCINIRNFGGVTKHCEKVHHNGFQLNKAASRSGLCPALRLLIVEAGL